MYEEKQNVEKKNHQREIKVKIKILHMTINDPWSDHPKDTIFGPIYPLFI